MSFTLASAAATALASVYNEIAGYFNGSSSVPANPIKLITLNDAVNPVLTLKNLDTTTGLVFDADKADGTNLALIDKNGFRYSSDGTTSGLTPVSISGTETVTGPKTFSAAAAFTSKVTWKRGTSTASAAALTLPTDGNVVPITGTTAITSITPTGLTGLMIVLEFASAGCKVTASSTLKLEGDFWSGAANATLTIQCDGTNWIEVGRSHASPVSCILNLTTSQEILDDAWTAITWLAPGVERNVGPCWSAGDPTKLSVPFPCLALLSAYGKWESNSTGRRRIAFELNGDGNEREWSAIEAASGLATTQGGSYPVLFTAASQYAKILVRQSSGGGLDMMGGADEEVTASLVVLAPL